VYGLDEPPRFSRTNGALMFGNRVPSWLTTATMHEASGPSLLHRLASTYARSASVSLATT
jgi:hypothetical protein